jgi:hypothetical protein
VPLIAIVIFKLYTLHVFDPANSLEYDRSAQVLKEAHAKNGHLPPQRNPLWSILSTLAKQIMKWETPCQI